MVMVTVILRLHQVGSCRRSNRTRRRRIGWNRECAEREQDGSGETISEFLHEVSLQVAPVVSVALCGEYEMNDTIVQSCIAPISRTIFRTSERFVGIHAPQSGLSNVARGSPGSNETPRAGTAIHHDEHARLDDRVDGRIRSRAASKADRLRCRPGRNQCGSPAGQQCAQHPTLLAIGVADAPPSSVLCEYLHGKMTANESPSQRIADAGSCANVGRLALHGGEAGDRKAASLDMLGGGRRAEQAAEQDRHDASCCANRPLRHQPLRCVPILRI